MTLGIVGVSKVFLDRKRGRGVVALKAIDLRVERNEFVCVIGPSGCGKTTLVNLIAGFDRPTTGTLLHNDREIAGPSPTRGVVFQDHSLFPWMSVQENIEFALVSKGITKAERKAVAIKYLDMVGLSEFRDSRPNSLSGGMRQKASVARTLVLDPKLLLMDEPFGSLDEETRRRMDSELISLWNGRKTVVFVTHSLEEAVMLGDRVVLMSSRPGRIVSEWTIPDPRPRDPMSPRMCRFKREISRRLTEAYHGMPNLMVTNDSSSANDCLIDPLVLENDGDSNDVE